MNPTSDELLTVEDIGSAIHERSISSVELTTELLRRADSLEHLGAYLLRFDDLALSAARRADEELTAGVDRGPLHGVPVAVKDIISTAEGPTTAQSLVQDPAWGAAIGDATCISRLRQSGAVVIGKTTTMEFAAGLFDPEKPFPVPMNPWSNERFPGGSSTGNAVGIVTGLFPGALGSDTGGSIRCPSAFCGITGLKPTFGLVPKSGCIPTAFSLDHIGPMSRSASGCAIILRAVRGFDPTDRCSAHRPEGGRSPLPHGSLAGLRIGVERRSHVDVSPDVAQALAEAMRTLEALGASFEEVTVPHFEELGIAAEVISRSELFAYHRETLMSRWSDYGRSMRQVALPGCMYTGADYVQAQRLRSIGQQDITTLLMDVDVIVGPTSRRGAPPVDGISRDGLKGELHTPVWNLLGNPALAMPIGFDREGMPLSLQVIGRPFDDDLVLQVGETYQQMTDWHRRSPDLPVRSAAAPIAPSGLSQRPATAGEEP